METTRETKARLQLNKSVRIRMKKHRIRNLGVKDLNLSLRLCEHYLTTVNKEIGFSDLIFNEIERHERKITESIKLKKEHNEKNNIHNSYYASKLEQLYAQ